MMSEDEARKLVEQMEKQESVVDTAPVVNKKDKTLEERHSENVAKRTTVKDGVVSFNNQEYSEIHGTADNGWKNIPMETLPSKGMFYPHNTELTIRSATVAEIRHWSTIDESDHVDMSSKLNYILEKCSRLKTPGNVASWKDTKEVDRFFIIFRIHELTFPLGENKLNLRFPCNGDCVNNGGYNAQVQLTSGHLNLFTLTPMLQGMYDENTRSFTKYSQRLNETIEMVVPSIGTVSYLSTYINEMKSNGDAIDIAFVRIVPFFVSDWRKLNEETINKLRQRTFSWDKNKMLFISGVVDEFKKCVSINVKHECERCGTLLERPLFFRGGFTIKDLFAVSNNLDGLV